MFSLALAVSALSTAASIPYCAGYNQRHSAFSTRADALLVGAATHHATEPGSIDLAMGTDDWRLVWASPAQSERGVFFFRRKASGYRLVDTWGGVALASERAATAAWAEKLGVPATLARCFADRVVDGK